MTIGKHSVREFSPPLDAEPRKRAVIVLMDGTWNDETGKDGDGVVTNVVKLYRCLREGPGKEQQIVRYFRGVGNDEEYSFWGRFKGGVFGKDEKRKRDDAYATIVRDWRPGDRLFLLGFSRGAASARMLASQLGKEGIPGRIRIFWEPKMNRHTRQIENRFVRYESHGKEAGGRQSEVDVEFLGVWDTVGAFGIPMKLFGIPFNKWNLFKDMTVSRSVQRAVHLVSVDETRKPFEPTLMNHDPDRIDEVWFPGVHSDVGGGYQHDALGAITLDYMVERMQERAAALGLELLLEQEALNAYLGERGDYIFHFHGLGRRKGIRSVHVLKDDEIHAELTPRVHASVMELRESRDTYSLVKKRRGLLRRIVRWAARVLYNPPNLRTLEARVQVVGRAGTIRPQARREAAIVAATPRRSPEDVLHAFGAPRSG